MHITIKYVSLNPAHTVVDSIQHYVIKFVSVNLSIIYYHGYQVYEQVHVIMKADNFTLFYANSEVTVMVFDNILKILKAFHQYVFISY
jgi:hypothetical protein